MLTTSQVEVLIAAMPTPTHRLLTMLVAATGMRISEARSLTVDRLRLGAPASVMVDRQLLGAATSPAVPIRFGPPKGGRVGKPGDRRARRPGRRAGRASGRPAVRFLAEPAQYAGCPLNSRSLSDVWDTAAARAGIDTGQHRGWHALRHHHASRLIAAGVTPVAVQRRLGHSSASITLDVYSHLWPSDEKTILDALSTP